jgi:hypothetical protein
MMDRIVDGQKYSYKIIQSSLGMADRMPYLPLVIASKTHVMSVEGLIDTGASVNVLPYEIGLQLGLDWDQETLSLTLAGNLARFEARAVALSGQVASFPAVDLAFAWTRSPNCPLILGQANFLGEFDVCFYRARSEFEIRPKRTDIP